MLRAEGERGKPDPRAVDSVMRAVDFVEGSLGRDIGLSDMAEAACYSPFHFSRVFSQATGHSPYDYLMRRRVAVAAEDLLGTDASVIDIALERGFGSPDTFTRAFRRCFGLSPSEARREGSYPRAIARTRIGTGQIREALARPMAPPSEVISGSVILAGPIAPLHGASDRYSVAQRDGSLSPSAGFEGRVRESADPAMEEFPSASVRIPPGRFGRFEVDGNEDRLAATIEYAYRCWLPLSGSASVPEFDIVEWVEGRPARLSIFLGREAGAALPRGRTAIKAGL